MTTTSFVYRAPSQHHRNHHNRPFLDVAALHVAYDCILSVPFRGSLAHVGVVGADDDRRTVIRGRGAGPADVRSTTTTTVVVHAISAGFLDGNQARLVVNGVDYSTNRRGVNAILVDPITMDIRVVSADTHLSNSDGNDAIQSFVSDAAHHPGWTFALAIKDDAALNMSAESRAALRSLGVDLPHHDDHQALEVLLQERKSTLPPRDTSILMNIAARQDAPGCIDVLARQGWAVNANAIQGLQNTPLHDAVQRGHVAATRTLLALGADPTLYNRQRRSPNDFVRGQHRAPSVIDMVRSSAVTDDDDDGVARQLDL